MTKVWPDFTKAQPRGRLKRAASVTRVAWGDRRRNCRVVEVGRGGLVAVGSETECCEASHVRLFVNVIPLSVPSLFARDNKLYNLKTLNFRRLEAVS